MPESKVRKEAAEKKKQAAKEAIAAGKKSNKPVNPGAGAWVLPTLLTLLVLGILWLVVYYLTASLGIYIPIISAAASEGGLGGWNVVVGMGFIAAAFIVATQWGKHDRRD
ncbi:MAG: cell division protein CrgA [Propionibacteriaceae bacterium]|nr:cell division protein CrgA [Propionibacteriaceae bacterium]